MDPKQNSTSQNPNANPSHVQQPVMPISGRSKEAPLMGQSHEWVSASTPEIVLPQEVQNAGVEAKPLTPSIPQAAQQLGVQHAKEAITPGSVSMEPVTLQTPHPIVLQLMQMHKNAKESFSWLIRLISRQQDREKNGGNA